MHEQDGLARRFEAERGRLRGLAYRVLGSAAEADDAVQETWLRLSRTDGVDNLSAWLRTVVSRICLDILRARRADPVAEVPDEVWTDGPEDDAVLLDSVGRALLVVLDTLAPAERVAFVLHDLFAVPFAEIAQILARTPATAKKLASRARLRVRGTPSASPADLARHRAVVDAFLAASRGGDLEALLALLAPDVVRRADAAALPPGAPLVAHGAQRVAKDTVGFGRRSRFASAALVDGAAGIVAAPAGRLRLAIKVTIEAGRITEYEVIADPARLRALPLAVL